MRVDLRAMGLAVALSLGLARVAWSASPEEQRRKLLEEVGLKKAAPAVPRPGAPVEDKTPAPPANPVPDRDKARPPAAASDISFRRAIHPIVVATCRICHMAGGAAAMSHLLLTGDAAVDHAAVVRFVDTRAAATSLLLRKAAGEMHGGGTPWSAGSAPARKVQGWIEKGARLDAASVPTPSTPPSSPEPPRATPPAPPHPALPAPAPAPAPPPERAPVPPVPPLPDGDKGQGTAPPAEISFRSAIHPLLVATCRSCHVTGGPAAALSRLLLSGDPVLDHAAVGRFIDTHAPAASPLLRKAAGEMHGGGTQWPAGSAPARTVQSWIGTGAHLDPAAASAEVAPPGPTPGIPAAPSPDVPVTVSSAPTAPGPPPPGPASPLATPPSSEPGLRLADPLRGFRLNGRFDVNYERGGFSDNPFKSSATDALRSYHHFLFLSRDSADDPFGLTVEMLGLLFWEAHTRVTPKGAPVEVLLRGGKLLVPFGAEPLFHQSYGGLAGFDQKVLPAVFSQEGVSLSAAWQSRAFGLSDDLYVVRGYHLTAADAVLNLQNDFSSTDDVRLAFGNRLGASWGPFSAWYSAIANGLGFGRTLFMQAADVTLWRVRGVPVLEYLSFAAGLLRADVSGGGHGNDYYHFASYFQVRVHPAEWLYVQYRQGVRTFNNRRGVWRDDTRLTSEEGGTHNFGIVARRHGLSAGIFYFINLENVAELPNDLLRVSLAYDF